MREVLPGVWHWTTMHPNIHVEVSSYWLEDAGVLIDPLVPREEGIDWFAARRRPPAVILLSNRHHYRESGRFAERFGCEVRCNSSGLHEFSDGREVLGFEIGDSLPGGVVAVEVDAICPDDTALYVPAARAVVFADGVVSGGPHGHGGPLGFVPDSLMDEPEETKRGLLRACERVLAELDFDHLLLAHGGPVIGDGRERLAELVAAGGRTAFEM
jgi:glyoxylase-like metal-dependent hydrolase (beta-lactamase superfamily II)